MSSSLTVAIDPHVHSEGSYDGHEPVELLLAQASEIGLDGIVVTDHDAIGESLRAAELAPEYGLVGIPGVEVSTAAGHLLAIGVTECPPPGRPFAETVEHVQSQGGVAVVPHPFQRTRHGVRKRHLKHCDVDAVEVFNPWVFTGYRNRRARRFAARHDYPGVAASDAHSAGFIGRAYTALRIPEVGSRADLTGEAVVDALDAADAAIHGRRQPIRKSTSHYLACAERKARWAVAPHVRGVASRFSF